MAAHVWFETWNGTRLDWAQTWTEGSPFELGAPPGITLAGALGISGDFAFVVARQLAGAGVASAQAQGTLEQTGPMRGNAIAGAVGQAALSVGVVLQGAAVARAQALGQLLAADLITGAAVAGALAEASLTVLPPEAGVPIGIGRRPVGRPRATAGGFTRIGRSNA